MMAMILAEVSTSEVSEGKEFKLDHDYDNDGDNYSDDNNSLQRSQRQKSVRASSRSRSRDNLAGKGFRDTRSRLVINLSIRSIPKFQNFLHMSQTKYED